MQQKRNCDCWPRGVGAAVVVVNWSECGVGLVLVSVFVLNVTIVLLLDLVAEGKRVEEQHDDVMNETRTRTRSR